MERLVTQGEAEDILVSAGMPFRQAIVLSEVLAEYGTLRIERRANPDDPGSIVSLSYTADGEWVLTVRA